jgi:tRNA modification GTPase
MLEKTICALSTPPVNSTIAVIRTSGAGSLAAAKTVFSAPDKIVPRHAAYGSIIESGRILDDVILIYYKSPSSFTGEDMIEIFCHGNRLVSSKILSLLVKNGMQLAAPGEFSKRAFLNGKIDLTEAEAINHLITAKSDWEIDISIDQMHGSLRKIIKELREKLILLKADIESAIDFAEEDIEFVTREEALSQIKNISDEISSIITRCRVGEKISYGIDAAIAGRPNTGKSSILNLILNQERAIVSDIPGTTRDIIRETVQIGGIHINLIDTAGIGIPGDELERLGIERSRKNIDSAGIIFMVLDATLGLLPEDEEIINKISRKKIIYIINKTDIADHDKISGIQEKLNGISILFSAKNGTGINELEKAITDLLSTEFADYKNSFAADMRIINVLEKSLGISQVINDLIGNNHPKEIIAFEIQAMIESLGEVTGEILPEDVLNSIFSRFCIGK